MPLYRLGDEVGKIDSSTSSWENDNTYARRVVAILTKHCLEYSLKHRETPIICASVNVVLTLTDYNGFALTNMKTWRENDLIGYLSGFGIYLCDNYLLNDEYFLTTYFKDVKVCKRKYKLDKIMNKLNVL